MRTIPADLEPLVNDFIVRLTAIAKANAEQRIMEVLSAIFPGQTPEGDTPRPPAPKKKPEAARKSHGYRPRHHGPFKPAGRGAPLFRKSN
jgi:hypothetical protein